MSHSEKVSVYVSVSAGVVNNNINVSVGVGVGFSVNVYVSVNADLRVWGFKGLGLRVTVRLFKAEARNWSDEAHC